MALSRSTILQGLQVNLDRLVYEGNTGSLPPETPHAFIYFITIANLTDRQVKLLGRKWVVEEANGHTQVLEGDKIVGKTPILKPGEAFSYNSYHVTANHARAYGAFYGVDEWNNPVHTLIPPFDLIILEKNKP